MPKLPVTINGRVFSVGCEPGEEARLKELAKYFDGRVSELAESVGQIGDLRLFLMAGLVIADEMGDARNRADALEKALKRAQAGGKAASVGAAKAENRATAALGKAAEQIEAIAGRAENAS